MFKIGMMKTSDFKKMMGAVEVLTLDATFTVTPEGMHTRQMDPSRVSMVDLLLPKQVFDTFICPKETRFAVDMELLLKFLARGSRGRMSVTQSAIKTHGALQLKFTDKTMQTRTFNLPSLEPEEPPPTPKANLPNSAILPASLLSSVCKDVQFAKSHSDQKEAD